MQYMYNWVILSSLFAHINYLLYRFDAKLTNIIQIEKLDNKMIYCSIVIDVNQRKQSAI